MLSVLIHTLGCKLNQLESEAYTDAFIKAGFALFDPSKADYPSLIIVNTCTVTSKADQKARRVIRKALRDYPSSCVIVTGCYAQLDKEDLASLSKEQRLFVIKGSEKEKILSLPALVNEKTDLAFALRNLLENEKLLQDKNAAFQFSPESFSAHSRSLLKIQDGCDKHCTYCRIRLARGKSISLDKEIALERLLILEKDYAEAVLAGVNVCQYRDFFTTNHTNGTNHTKNRENGLTELLEYLLAGTQRIALRLSSLEPDFIDEKFASVVSNKRVRGHFHLSIQSGSKTVLERMGRSYNSDIIEKAVSLLRSAKEDPFLACDIITGFPGETEEEFLETYNLCKKIGFAWIHVFPYSKRKGTAAFSFPGTVQESEVTKRVQLFTDLAWQTRAEYVKRWIGREVDVLVEKGKGSRGVTENYLKVLIKCEGKTAPQPGTVLRCRLTALSDNLEDYDVLV